MVLSVDYSSRVVLGFTVVVGFAICTVLFIRARGNRPAQPLEPSLDKERVSSIDSPNFSWVHDPMNPMDPMDPIKPRLYIGAPLKAVKTFQELADALTAAKEQHPACESLVIYGFHNLEIAEDPGILALEPMKLVFSGCCIDTKKNSSFVTSMINAGWCLDGEFLRVVKVPSVEEGVYGPVAYQPTIYRVFKV